MQENPGTEVVHPSGLLTAARDLLRYSDPATAGMWPRAASYLARQALEQSLEEFWQHRAPGVERASVRAQLLCLRSYADEEIAESAAHVWHALSRACHHHPYELAPTGQELSNWITDVERVADALSGQANG
jgi:hypothetical protein